ncbi:MAG: hypothetical protein IT290_08625, partial [Deltaproteobacteria bacterium]|nr:hypothetical protein [Deltaproteobacteria bacterium]
EEFVHRAGAKNPSDRFESVDEMLEILEAQISGIKPPRARRFPAAWQRAAIPTLASLALCLLVVVIGVASHQGPVPVAPKRVDPPQPPSSASVMQAKPPMVAPTAIAPLIEFVPMPMQQNSNRQPYPEDRDRYREQPRRDESMRRPMRPVERMKDPRRLREQFEERRPIFRDPRNR